MDIYIYTVTSVCQRGNFGGVLCVDAFLKACNAERRAVSLGFLLRFTAISHVNDGEYVTCNIGWRTHLHASIVADPLIKIDQSFECSIRGFVAAASRTCGHLGLRETYCKPLSRQL